MAPSPVAGKQQQPQQTGTPKTPTKLTRRPAQTPQKSVPPVSSGKPAPSTPKTPQATKPIGPVSTQSLSRPKKPNFGEKARDTAHQASNQTKDAAAKAGSQAQQTQSGIEPRDGDEGDYDGDGGGDDGDDDDGPLSKVAQAGQQSQHDLKQAEPEPIKEDDDDDDLENSNGDAVGGAQSQAQEGAEQVVDGTAEDATAATNDDAMEKAGQTVQSNEDDEQEHQKSDEAEEKKHSLGQRAPDPTGVAKDPAGKASDIAGKATKDPAGNASDIAGKATKDPSGTAEDSAGDVERSPEDSAQNLQEATENGVDEGQRGANETIDEAEDAAKGTYDQVEGTDQADQHQAQDVVNSVTGQAKDTAENTKNQAENATGQQAPDIQIPQGLPLDLSVLKGLEVEENGTIYDREGNAIGKLVEGDAEDLAGYPIGDDGEILDDDGDLVGRVELTPDQVRDQLQEAQEQGQELPEGAEEFLSQYQGEAANAAEDGIDEAVGNLPSLSILEGYTCGIDGLIYDDDGNTIGRVTEGDPQELQNAVLNDQGEFVDQDGNVVGYADIHEDVEELVQKGVYEPAQQTQQTTDQVDGGLEQAGEELQEQVDGAQESAEDVVGQAEEGSGEIEDQLPGIEALQGRELNEAGDILDEEGNVLGGVENEDLREKIAEGELDPKTLKINEEGQVLDDEGNVLGKTELTEGAAEGLGGPQTMLDFRILDGKRVNKKGKILDDDGEEIGELIDGELSQCVGARANEKGEVYNRAGELVGHVHVVSGEAAENATKELLEELGELDQDEEQAEGKDEEHDEDEVEDEIVPQMEEPDTSILDGLKVNKKGKVINEDGEPIGELTAGELSQCAGKKINSSGEVLDASGNIIGHVRTLPQEVQQEQETPPISLLEGLKVNKKGQVLNEDGEPIGELTAGDIAECAGKKINNKGEVLNDSENVIGSVRTLPTEAQEAGQLEEETEQIEEEDRQPEEEEEGDQLPPLSTLEGLTVNKAGKLIDDNGAVVGELVEGDPKKLSKAGITCDADGQFWDNKGHIIGRAQTLPQEEPEEEAAFAGLEGLHVVEDGWVQDDQGNTVGYVTEGDAKKLLGRVVDEDGDILDKNGSVVGHADRYAPEEEEEQPEEMPDLSFLKGKTMTKTGLIIGDEGIPVARLAEGNAKELQGRQLDDQGQFWNDVGSVIGRVELIPEEEREAKPEGPFAGLEDLRVVEGGKIADEDGNVVGEIVEGNAKRLLGLAVDEDGDIVDKYGNVKGHAEPLPEEEPIDYSILDGLTLNKQGWVVDDNGVPFGKIVEGNPADLAGHKTDENGYIYNDTGKVVGRCEPLPEEERVKKQEGPFAGLEGLHVIEKGKVMDSNDNVVGQIVDGDPKKLLGMHVDEDGDIVDKFGNVKGHAEPLPDEEEVDYSILDGLTLNKHGLVVDTTGTPYGRLVEGNASELAGRQCDEQGFLYNDRGKIVGKAEPLPEEERVSRPEGPFAGLEGLHVVKEGKIEDENGNVVGEITEGDPKRLVGMKVDEDGDIIDKFGNTKGHAEPLVEEDEQPLDNSALEGKYLNKQGYVVDDKGIPFGRLVEGNASELAGRKCDENGHIYGDTGKVVGRCEILPENERVARPEGPFAGLEGLRVVKDGYVEDEDSNVVGQLVEGNPKRLVGLHVDEDGDIIDKYGNVKGHAEPWLPEEEEPVDLSRLSGTTINKAGYAVDGSGAIIGRVAEGDPSVMIGKKVDGKGQIWDDAGNVIGRCELAQGEGGQEGPFAGFDGLQINKNGTVTTPNGDIVGRIIEGDIKKLLGHTVDEDGDITDKNGNTIGKAERWEPEEKERRVNPMSGMRVNKEGEVRDENGDLLGKLTMGDLGHCVGQEIDDAGNVVDVEGNKIGEVTLLENIAEDEYEGPSEEELEEARKREEERQIAEKMAGICTQTLEKMHPICKQIRDYMDKADNTPKEELDEEELVNNVKPLIEEGGRILQECNGSLRGLDPDGRIAAQAKGRAGTGEATPEEYRLAETLKELTTTVVTTIDDAKKKLNNMPHAKKKLNPLWGLMTQPLFQILAAVGLLLAGVLGLVGQLLNGLGLGGLVNGLLGGLGINKLLASFGLIDDKKKDNKKKEGGNKLSSLPIVGGLLSSSK